MPKLDEAKENLAMLKFWIGVIISVFTVIVGWVLNKLDLNENILIAAALSTLILLIIALVYILIKINRLIKEIGKLKK